MRASRGQVFKKLSGTQQLAPWVVGMVPQSLVVDVEGMYDMFLSIPPP